MAWLENIEFILETDKKDYSTIMQSESLKTQGKQEKSSKLCLNLGCGSEKINGCVNVDIEASLNPDVVCDFRKALPYETETVDKVYLFHVIEHIEEKHHVDILSEIWRVLRFGSRVYISYPEFKKVARNYIENHLGMRDFWRATIYGRQLYPSDYHVALMDSDLFKVFLEQIGFDNVIVTSEAKEPWNTVVCATKVEAPLNYIELLNKEIFKNGSNAT